MRVPKSLRQHPPLWVVHALREGSHLLGAFHSQAASTQFYQNIFWKFVHLKQNCDPTSQEVCPYLHFEERPTQTEMLSVFVRLCPCQRLYQEFENFLKYWPIFSSSFSPQRALTKPSFPHPWVVSSDVHDALAKCLDSLNPSCTPSPVPHSENGLVIHHLRNFLNLFFGYDSMMISFSQWVKHRRSESHSIFLNMLRPSQTVLIFCPKEDLEFGKICRRTFVNEFSHMVEELYQQGCALNWVGSVSLFSSASSAPVYGGYRVQRKEMLTGVWSMQGLLNSSSFDKLVEMVASSSTLMPKISNTHQEDTKQQRRHILHDERYAKHPL